MRTDRRQLPLGIRFLFGIDQSRLPQPRLRFQPGGQLLSQSLVGEAFDSPPIPFVIPVLDRVRFILAFTTLEDRCHDVQFLRDSFSRPAGAGQPSAIQFFISSSRHRTAPAKRTGSGNCPAERNRHSVRVDTWSNRANSTAVISNGFSNSSTCRPTLDMIAPSDEIFLRASKRGASAPHLRFRLRLPPWRGREARRLPARDDPTASSACTRSCRTQPSDPDALPPLFGRHG